MRYLAGLIVFTGVGAFLITDTVDFWQDFKRRDRPSRWSVDLLRLLFLAAIMVIGYRVAAETFRSSSDQLTFLAIGLGGAVGVHLLSQKIKSSNEP